MLSEVEEKCAKYVTWCYRWIGERIMYVAKESDKTEQKMWVYTRERREE